MKKIILLLLLANAGNALAQYPRVDIPGSEVRKITSSIVAGQEYELHILLPGNYKNSTKKYPVVYLMDSQWDFPLVKSIYGEQYYDGFVPELIIVGVTWGGKNPNYDSLRARDYSPTHMNQLRQSGGSDKFLSFMKNELFPFIESNYRADPENRSLMGCSFGGLITLYAFLTHTDMFNGYAAASPYVGWDNTVISKFEEEFANRKVIKPVRVYMTIGDVERSRPVYERVANSLMGKNFENVSIRSKILENTGHSGTKGETFARGLQFIFEKPKLKLDDGVLNQLTGKYQWSNGNHVEVKNENNQLVIYFSPNFKYELFAASPTDFYSNSEFFNLNFKTNAGKVEGFDLARFNNTQFLKKVN